MKTPFPMEGVGVRPVAVHLADDTENKQWP